MVDKYWLLSTCCVWSSYLKCECRYFMVNSFRCRPVHFQFLTLGIQPVSGGIKSFLLVRRFLLPPPSNLSIQYIIYLFLEVPSPSSLQPVITIHNLLIFGGSFSLLSPPSNLSIQIFFFFLEVPSLSSF